MKLKRLLALVGGVFSLALNSAFAQTDVTSEYLTNAGFDTESDFQVQRKISGS